MEDLLFLFGTPRSSVSTPKELVGGGRPAAAATRRRAVARASGGGSSTWGVKRCAEPRIPWE